MRTINRAVSSGAWIRVVRILCGFVPSLLVANMADGQQAAAPKAEIAVTYTWVANEEAPKPGVAARESWTQKFVLAGKTVEYSDTRNGRELGTVGSALGSSRNGRNTNKLAFRSAIHILAGGLVQTVDYSSYVITETITTDGRRSCSATRTYRLKPGHRLFETGGEYVFSGVHAEDITCSIREVRD